MKLVLYLLILLGATLLAFDLAKEVKEIEQEPVPEPTKPIRPQDTSDASSGTPHAHSDGHAEAKQQLEQSIEQFTSEIEKNPNQAGPYIKRAEVYTQLRQHQKALTNLNKAATLSPDNAEVFFQRGYTWIATGQGAKSLADFSRVLEIDPSHIKARRYRAIIRFRNNEFQPALDDSLELLKHDSTFYDAHLTASRCYMELNNKAKAVEHLNTYIANSKDPDGLQEARRLIELWNQEPEAPADSTPAPSNPSSTPSTDHE